MMRIMFINPMMTHRMSKKRSFYLWLLFGAICLFTILLTRRYNYQKEYFSQPIISQVQIEEILHQQRLDIEKEMKGYPYGTLMGRNIRLLSGLTMERGGTPFRSIIVSTWRSGSTFFADLLMANPASFYYYEPMLGHGEFRVPLSSRKPLDIVDSLLKCNFSNLGYYLESRKTDKWHPDDYNPYLKKQCKKYETICHDSEFSTRFCSLFPFHVMKIVGLDLASMDYFLRDKNLGVKVVFLVRDPRGVMNSRKGLDWCQIIPSCNNSISLCSNMVSDYLTAVDFSKRYPNAFGVLRYEDLISDLWNISQKIYFFYGIHFHENVKKFINTHTHTALPRDGDPYSTFRNSKVVVSQWKELLTFKEVNDIQDNCREAMNIWGYDLATNSDYQRNFNPVKPLSSVKINHF